uniref:Uncharacterized protein n=1 Tax=Dulem virus 157 TaxID=3145634 RepID=A0AAU8B684_9VIRU
MMQDKEALSAITKMRDMMKRLGYLGVSIKSVSFDDDIYIVSGVDPMDQNVVFCRPYTVEDMKCITHVSDIFWRYIK